MRILSVSNCPLDPNLGSGAMVLEFARRLQARGHAVTLLGPEDYTWLPRLSRGRRLRTLAGYTQATLRAVQRERFDLVELWGAEAWWTAERLARRRLRPRLVARSNGLEPLLEAVLAQHGLVPPARPLAALFDRWQRRELAFRRVDALTTVSEYDRAFALARGYQRPDRLVTVENALAPEWLGQAFVAERAPVIGFVGSAIPNKGGALLLQAVATVLEAHPGWTVRIIGADGLRAADHIPPALGPRVEQVPFVADRAELRRLYQGMSIVALPTAYESFGLVAAEAMACGCLLVAGRTGFAAGLRAGGEALLVPERTVPAWRAALQAAVADPVRRTAMARAGHARAQALRWDSRIDRLEALYAELVSMS